MIAHPFPLNSVSKPEFVELPTVFVIPLQKQLIDRVVQVDLALQLNRLTYDGNRDDGYPVSSDIYSLK
jgi:hypothetical protein